MVGHVRVRGAILKNTRTLRSAAGIFYLTIVFEDELELLEGHCCAQEGLGVTVAHPV